MPVSRPQHVDHSVPAPFKVIPSGGLGAKEEAWLQRFESNPNGEFFGQNFFFGFFWIFFGDFSGVLGVLQGFLGFYGDFGSSGIFGFFGNLSGYFGMFRIFRGL
jgi:hypothetical protein